MKIVRVLILDIVCRSDPSRANDGKDLTLGSVFWYGHTRVKPSAEDLWLAVSEPRQAPGRSSGVVTLQGIRLGHNFGDGRGGSFQWTAPSREMFHKVKGGTLSII